MLLHFLHYTRSSRNIKDFYKSHDKSNIKHNTILDNRLLLTAISNHINDISNIKQNTILEKRLLLTAVSNHIINFIDDHEGVTQTRLQRITNELP